MNYKDKGTMNDGTMAIVNRARSFLGKARDGIVRRGNITQKEALKIMDAAINILKMARDAENAQGAGR